jgi:hypothetical protein
VEGSIIVRRYNLWGMDRNITVSEVSKEMAACLCGEIMLDIG